MTTINPYFMLAIAAGVLAGYLLAKNDGGCGCSSKGSSSSPYQDWQ